ncbi:MAG TPA: thiol-disulfide oxidoreductase DCC family protein [Flavitalea sp.]|nr:thiol-disulfide oxidoreductase DCC family protein [Flavitalea sp.]
MNDPRKPVILFDGVCNYCNSMVNFIIRQDKQKKFVFAPLQSASGQQLLQKHNLPFSDFDSFVLIDGQKAYLRSTASLNVLKKLPWYWKWTQVFWIVPPFLRDAVYNLVARNRYKWFGKRKTCMIPSPDVKARFLN